MFFIYFWVFRMHITYALNIALNIEQKIEMLTINNS